jgi:hypothetical protein
LHRSPRLGRTMTSSRHSRTTRRTPPTSTD